MNTIPFTDPADASPADVQAALLAEIERLTAALHANQCHPDWTYAITTGGSPVLPPAEFGVAWEPNTDPPMHGRGTKPANTWWFWKRRLDDEENDHA